MESDWRTVQQLIDFAQQQGYTGVTARRVERWHKEDAIPRPQVMHLGRGLGTRSLYPAAAEQQLVAVCRLQKQGRKFDLIRFQLWCEGYSVPLPRLKQSIRQVVFPLRWQIPHDEEERYDAADQRLESIMQKTSGRRRGFFAKKLFAAGAEYQSFLSIQFYLLYGTHYLFGPSYHKGEPSAADLFAQGLQLQELRFLPKDMTQDFQTFSTQGLLSLRQMNWALDEATEEILRRAHGRIEVIPLLFEGFELMGMLPRLLPFLRKSINDTAFQAFALVFLLNLEQHGYAGNMDELLGVLRIQLPRIRAYHAFYGALQQELPQVAKELLVLEQLAKQIQERTEPEREQYLAQEIERMRGVYAQNQADLDAFWQRHADIRAVFDESAV